MRRLLGLVVLGAVAATSACAPKIVAVPTVTTPAFPDFIQPVVPTSLANSRAVANHDRAWTFLQAGDTKNAARELGVALKASPAFYPAEATAGYVELAQKNPKGAITRFDRALERQKDYVPALVGKGQALVGLNREADAVAVFEAALASDPSLTDVARRVEVFKFRGLERDLAAAREAARTGRTEEAVRAYHAAIASSPDSPFLYRELGILEGQHGNTAAALEHLRKAVQLDPGDAASLAQIGDLLAAQGDLSAAIESYAASLAVEPNADVETRRDAARARADLARLPEEYRAIESAQQLTRGDLAALIGVRLGPLLPARGGDAGVVTDVRGNWAEPWIFAVVRAGIIEALPNHTFQPRGVVRRVDFAQVVNRLLAGIAQIAPSRAKAWQDARIRFTDLAPGHIAYPAASAAVAAGVLPSAPDGSFQPTRVVTGAEAIAALGRLQALANLRTGQQAARP